MLSIVEFVDNAFRSFYQDVYRMRTLFLGLSVGGDFRVGRHSLMRAVSDPFALKRLVGCGLVEKYDTTWSVLPNGAGVGSVGSFFAHVCRTSA